MAAVVGIISRHGLTIETCCKNQPNKNKLVLYKPLLSLQQQVYISNKIEWFSYTGGCSVCGHCTHIEVFKRRAELRSK